MAKQSFRILVLTDHSIHSEVDSIYPLAAAFSGMPEVDVIDLASRGEADNRIFFEDPKDAPLRAIRATGELKFLPEGEVFHEKGFQTELNNYNLIFLRLPRRNSISFFHKISEVFDPQNIFNRPEGIIETGDKAFLMNFPKHCPPMALCKTQDEIEDFATRFPVVLKPLNNSGGRGIMKIENGEYYLGNRLISKSNFFQRVDDEFDKGGMLAMKYLKRVGEGDKRVIVVDGEIMAAAIRFPAEGSWMCNVAQGGHSEMAEASQEEIMMAKDLSEVLSEKGVVLFGLDTLVDDDGKRVLSEINSSCVNGIYPAQMASGKPVVQNTASAMMNFFQRKVNI